jgi:WhiB family redox-sensing transcriptional regulator
VKISSPLFSPEPNSPAPEWTGTMPLITPEPWAQDALCAQVDPNTFFPDKGDTETTKRAKAVCARCNVVEQCLEYALRTNQRHGVWGGQSIAVRRNG